MNLIYLPTNAAWVFLWGSDIIPMLDQRFFPTREDAVARAQQARLLVDRDGTVASMCQACEQPATCNTDGDSPHGAHPWCDQHAVGKTTYPFAA